MSTCDGKSWERTDWLDFLFDGDGVKFFFILIFERCPRLSFFFLMQKTDMLSLHRLKQEVAQCVGFKKNVTFYGCNFYILYALKIQNWVCTKYKWTSLNVVVVWNESRHLKMKVTNAFTHLMALWLHFWTMKIFCK